MELTHTSATSDLRLRFQPQSVTAYWDRYQIVQLRGRNKRVWTTCPESLLSRATTMSRIRDRSNLVYIMSSEQVQTRRNVYIAGRHENSSSCTGWSSRTVLRRLCRRVCSQSVWSRSMWRALDCAHDQLTLGVTGSTSSGQFSFNRKSDAEPVAPSFNRSTITSN